MNYELTDLYLDLIDERKGQRTPQRAGIEKLLDEIDSDPELGRAERALLRGYLNYHFREVMQPIDRETEFRLAVELAPDDHLANLYLGYETFDTGNYATALEQFQKLDLNKHVLWSQIKIRELIASCQLDLGDYSIAEKNMTDVLNEALELEIAEYALPTELVRALSKNVVEFQSAVGGKSFSCCLNLLNQVMQHHELNDLFEKELRQIRQVA